MAKHFTLTSSFCLLLLATTLTLATSARILDEETPPFPLPAASSDPIPPPETVAPATTDHPSGQIPAVPTTNVAPPEPTPIEEEPAAVPATNVAPPEPTPIEEEPAAVPATNVAPPEPTPTVEEPAAPAVAAPVVPTTNVAPPETTAAPLGGAAAAAFSFFMHDVLGGSHPSGRAVAGIVANSDANNLPFSKPSNPIFPINGGVPLNTVNGAINSNNYPFLVGLNGAPSSTLVQSNGNNAVAGNNNQQAFVTAGQLPQGLTLNQLTFGSVTVVDNELTEGHELGSGVLGRAQGIYITSSSDGSSHTVALTAAFHGHEHEVEDTVSFFGVHRTATPVSHIAIVGGTGKYENAKGFAAIETMPHQDQHTTDGIETITHFTVYITP
ncbi:dirigent protein 24-like [Salvia miltiorrhiza]|uniref:dirigent protein 24-like n=1 Tax=Salvia miltiorrhiza TaxID=226208 RepID=UPI0025AC9335|nr:dirigent protein 24-like [Salvia miltiorrhiza]